MTNAKTNAIDQGHRGWLVLFTSSTTLICGALPIVLVSLGLGAVSASWFSNLPFLVIVAQYKTLLFILSGGVLAIAAYLVFKPN